MPLELKELPVLHPDLVQLKHWSQTFPVPWLFTPGQCNHDRNVCSRCLCLTCGKGRRLFGKALKGGWAALQTGTLDQCSHKKCPISKSRMVVPACTPGLYRALFTLVKNSVFISLGVVIEMQGCGISLDSKSPFSPSVNYFLIISVLAWEIPCSCFLPSVLSMARTLFPQISPLLGLDWLKAGLISALGITKTLSCFSLIVMSGTSLCPALWP